MAYRNKTFVSFASEDLARYRLMTAWHANEHIEFDFHNAHDLNNVLSTSQPDTIRRRLHDRLANTKQVVLLVGDTTRQVAANTKRFLHYEVEAIVRLGLPVVLANLDGSRSYDKSRIPGPLHDYYTMSVSFQPKVIKYALDEYVPAFQRGAKSTPHVYGAGTYVQLSL